MDIELWSEDGHGLEFLNALPQEYLRFQNVQSLASMARADFGEIVLHHLQGPGFTIWHSRYAIKTPVVLRTRASLSALELRIAVQNGLQGTWDGIVSPSLPQHQFNLSYTPFVETRAVFKAEVYETLDFHFEQSFLERLAPDFPVLGIFLEQVMRGRAGDLSPHAHFCTADMIAIIQVILDNPYSPSAQKHLLEYKAKELLIHALDVATRSSVPEKGFKLSNSDREALLAARLLIEQHPDDPLSLMQLCKKVYLNEFKLKKGFRMLFGVTAYDYHIQLKMEEAKRLLLDTDLPIKDIAYTIGYQHDSNFCIEFKKRFGMQPSYFRKHGKI